MSGTNPVEPKPPTPAVAATALTEPAPAAAAKAKLWMIGFKQKYWLAGGVACGLALAAGVYGYKYLTTAPGKVVAQSEAPPSPPAKSTETPKSPAIADEIPPVIVSPIRTVKDETPVLDIKVPIIKPLNVPETEKPATILGSSETVGPPPIQPPNPDKPVDNVKTDGPPPLILPLPFDEKKKPEDPFKAPGTIPGDDKKTIEPIIPSPLPTDVRDRKEIKPGGPVLTTGGLDPTPPAKKDEPIVAPPPPVPGATGTKKDDPPPPPPPPPPVPDVSPITAPNPKKEDPKAPAIPSVPDVSPIAAPPVVSPKSPAISLPGVALPDTGPAPMIPSITIGDPPAPPIGSGPTPEEKKKGIYDEDWHTQREGDTYALISREYYKTADFAAALEAYNRERTKNGERIIRVPPPWVLEEQFPNLLNKPEKTIVPEPKSTGSIKFEPVAPAAGTRPAPAPLSRSNDEYRVINEAGETIREIARKVYGNENAWRKVFDQNPGIDPTQPIPSGTTLRVAK